MTFVSIRENKIRNRIGIYVLGMHIMNMAELVIVNGSSRLMVHSLDI